MDDVDDVASQLPSRGLRYGRRASIRFMLEVLSCCIVACICTKVRWKPDPMKRESRKSDCDSLNTLAAHGQYLKHSQL